MVEYTIEHCLKESLNILKGSDVKNIFLDSELILAHLLKKDRVYILTHRERIVGKNIFSEFIKLVMKRKTGYPLQYITNRQEFMGLDFYVKEGVLIPRPDTENIAERILSLFPEKSDIEIIDLGAGTGAIGLSLAHFFPAARVTLVDISDEALENVFINIERLGLKNAHARKMDIFSENILMTDCKYDLVVSNPPYIPEKEIKNLQKEVSQFEPVIALSGGEKGLDYYFRIAEIFPYITKSSGILALEIGYNQAEDVCGILTETGKIKNIEIIKDLQGYNRGIIAAIR